MEIADELTAFEFDAVCSYVLTAWENKREATRLKLQLQGIAAIAGADVSKFDSEEDYGDAGAEVM